MSNKYKNGPKKKMKKDEFHYFELLNNLHFTGVTVATISSCIIKQSLAPSKYTNFQVSKMHHFLSFGCLLFSHKSSAPQEATKVATNSDSEEMSRRGAFILFEGVDRCGKSTQVQLLTRALGGAEDIRFPNRTSRIGQLINDYLSSASQLSDHTVHLLFSANRWEQAKEIEEKLKAGVTLVGAASLYHHNHRLIIIIFIFCMGYCLSSYYFIASIHIISLLSL